MRYKIIVSYDGTKYNGFQSQKNGNTIQNELEQAIFQLTNEEVSVVPSGRTDAGVHALAQVCHFDLTKDFSAYKMPRAMNNFLPLDISVKSAEKVSKDFHARRDVVQKTYTYTIHFEKNRSPLSRLYAFNTSYDLNIDLMKNAAVHFIGEHDFKGFRKVGSSAKTTVRTIYDLSVFKTRNNEIEISITGNGFLYNMVRIIAGTLFEVGIGKINSEDIPDIIKSGDRSKAGKTLPANGLCLKEVIYEIK